jgi:cytidine deaminase
MPPAETQGYAASAAAPRHTPAPCPGDLHGAEHVDWEALRAKAIEIMGNAYAPYSNFPVGVAGIVDDGRVVVGCNVENAAYGVGLCAECGMVSELHATGGGRLVAVSCVGGDGQPLMPCGRCRQLLWENGGPDCLLLTPEGVLPMRDVLPQAFGADNLTAAEARSHRE